MSIHDRIRRRREELGLSQAELARRVGVSTQAVQQWESLDEGARTAPRRAARRKVADVLGVTLLWLEYGDELPGHLFEEIAKGNRVPKEMRGRDATGYRSVPIIGFAVATPDEDGYFDDMGFPPGAGEAYIPWPTRDPNAYALRVKNDSMAPRIRAGEVVVVEPGTTASPGDDVLVKLKNGRKMVKELLYQRGGAVTFGSINQAYKPVTISLDEIESVQFVAGRARGAMTKEETP